MAIIKELESFRENQLLQFWTDKGKIKLHRTITKFINDYYDSCGEKVHEEEELKEAEETTKYFAMKFDKSKKTRRVEGRVKHLVGISISGTVGSNEKSFVEKRGFAYMATYYENEYFDEFSRSKKLNDEEKQRVEVFKKSLEKSLPINYALANLIGEHQDEEVWTFAGDLNFLRCISRKAYQSILELENGESILLDLSYPGHRMRAQIQKRQNKITLRLFETSGMLEALEGESIFQKIKGFYKYLGHKKENVALRVDINTDTFEQEGRNGLNKFSVFMLDLISQT